MANNNSRTFTRAALLVLIGSLLPLQASAQGRFCIGGDTAQLTPVQKSSCRQKLDMVRDAAARFHAPDDWHFVVVCDDAGWSDYAAFSKRSEAELTDAVADTDLEEHSTYFRADRLAPEAGIPSLDLLIAREIAGIKLQTVDEKLIQQQVALWLPQVASEAPVLIGSM